MKRGLTLAGFLGVAWGLQALALPLDHDVSGGKLTFLVGLVLMASLLAGQVAQAARLPRITGYILLGWMVGPDLLGFLDTPDLESLRIIEDIAISLIAFAAGGELRIGALRRRWRQIVGIMTAEMATVFVTLFAAVVLLSSRLPLTSGMTPVQASTVALIFASIAIANSPAVAIAVLSETRAQGPVSSTILAVTILKDVLVVVLFAGALGVARVVVGGGEEGIHGVGWVLGWEVVGSLATGLVVGWVVTLYMARFRGYSVLSVLGAALGTTLVAASLHLEALLMALSAGFFVRNLGPGDAKRFVRAVEANAIPFYALFFSLAGAGIRLRGLREVGLFVLLFVALRAVAIFLGTRLGALLTRAPSPVARYAWTGFLSQAGVALGMVMLAARAFPEWGGALQTMLVAMVAVHEILGPVIFHQGLRRSGEVGAAAPVRKGRGGEEGQGGGEPGGILSPVEPRIPSW